MLSGGSLGHGEIGMDVDPSFLWYESKVRVDKVGKRGHSLSTKAGKTF